MSDPLQQLVQLYWSHQHVLIVHHGLNVTGRFDHRSRDFVRTVAPDGRGPWTSSSTTVCLGSGGVVSASQAEEEGVAALGAVHGVVFVVEVQDVLLRFEAKLLVQQHGRVTGRHVQSHILPHARLKHTQDV